MDGAAIDFYKLLKEERKRAKQKKKRPAQHDEGTSSNANEEKKHEEQSAACNEGFAANDQSIIQHIHQEKEQHQVDVVQEWKSSIEVNPLDRQAHLLCQVPPTIYYLPNFFSNAGHQASLVTWLQSLPEIGPPQSNDITNQNSIGWTTLRYAKRRVCLVDLREKQQSQQIATTNMAPPMLDFFLQALVDMEIFTSDQPPNHILINEYLPGQGILAHTDGPAYWSTTATLSLESSTLIDFTPRPNYGNETNDEKTTPSTTTNPCSHDHGGVQIYLEPGSLLVFQDDAYVDYLHGIPDRIEPQEISDTCVNPPANKTTLTRGYRISLTFRHKFPGVE